MTRRTWLTIASASLLLREAATGSRCSAAEPTEKDARDAAVLEALFVDLLDDPKSPIEVYGNARRLLRYFTEPDVSPIKVEEMLRQHDARQWKALSHAQLEGARQAAVDLTRRAAAKDGFKEFTPKDKRVLPYSPEQRDADTKAALFLRPQFFSAFPPGYSPDGSLAVVRLGFTWSGGRHFGQATYVLERKMERWIVLVRDITRFV